MDYRDPEIPLSVDEYLKTVRKNVHAPPCLGETLRRVTLAYTIIFHILSDQHCPEKTDMD
jgi:hypothetical protein